MNITASRQFLRAAPAIAISSRSRSSERLAVWSVHRGCLMHQLVTSKRLRSLDIKSTGQTAFDMTVAIAGAPVLSVCRNRLPVSGLPGRFTFQKPVRSTLGQNWLNNRRAMAAGAESTATDRPALHPWFERMACRWIEIFDTATGIGHGDKIRASGQENRRQQANALLVLASLRNVDELYPHSDHSRPAAPGTQPAVMLTHR